MSKLMTSLVVSLVFIPSLVFGGTPKVVLPPEEVERQKLISEYRNISEDRLENRYRTIQQRILSEELILACDTSNQCKKLSWSKACKAKAFFLFSEKHNPFIQGQGPVFSDTEFAKLVSAFYDLHEVHMQRVAEKACEVFSLEGAFCVDGTCQPRE